jgi:hypothetical protein
MMNHWKPYENIRKINKDWLSLVMCNQIVHYQIDRAQSFKLWMGTCLITKVKPTPTNAQWKMEGMWM